MNENINGGVTTDNENNSVVTDTSEDYLSVIKKLKSESVPVSEYEKLRKENKNLLNSLVTNSGSNEPVKKKSPDIKELRQKLFSNELTNLEYCKTAVELRKALIAEGKPDPFLPVGRNIAPDETSINDANNVADVLEQCIEYADGDSSIFTDALQRHMVDLPRPRRR